MKRWLLLVFFLVSPAWALDPSETLTDPALEARARAVSQQLRCLVCQNESIDTSNADLARTLRHIVRERLEAGDSNVQVLDYMRARYGDFILMRPPLKPRTYLLWFAPLGILVLGVGVLVRVIKNAGRAP